MTVCEECWDLASWKVAVLGGSVVDRYRDEIAAHPDGHAAETDGDK